MYKKNKICVIVPAYNEEILIVKTLDTIPNFVDLIVVIDDCSQDNTQKKLVKYQKNKRFKIIKHEKNKGVGASIVTGYKYALEKKMDCAIVMAGDGQMSPKDLPNLIDPLVIDDVDYVKGNRLLYNTVRKVMPQHRFIGNSLLTILTKISSGYWDIMDPQCGYTAINKKSLKMLPLDNLYPRFGFPNDILTMLNIYGLRVKDVLIEPIYGEEKSKIRLWSYVPKVSYLLLKNFFKRIIKKYFILDFHPLGLFYLIGLILFPVGFILGCSILYHRIFEGIISISTVILSVLLVILGIQFLLFALLFDYQYNRTLER